MKHTWARVRLGDVLTLHDTSIPVSQLGEVNIAGVYSFARGLFKRSPISPAKTSYKSFNRLVTNDFVISEPKAWEGAIARVTPEFEGWFLSPVFPSFRVNRERLEPAFLEWFCRRPAVWAELQRNSRGIGARRETVHPAQFLALDIPLPPLAEQRRVAARIEELAAQIHDARTIRRQAEREAAALSQASSEASYRRLRDHVGCQRFADVCETITDGDHNTPPFTETGIRFIFVGNVSSGCLHFDNSKRVDERYFRALSSQRVPLRGDILYSAVGATLGIPAVVDTDEPFCFQRHVAILKPNRDLVDSQFVWHMLRSRTAFEKAWASTTGSAQPTVPLRAIRELPIPVPSLEDQRQIASELGHLQAETDGLCRLQAETATEVTALLPAVLDRAFKGEL